MRENGQKQSRKKPEQQRSFILTLALVALIVYFTISLVSLQFRIHEQQQKLASVQTQYAQVQKENEELKEIVAEDDDEAYMEQVARNVLGYVLPGEEVYYDVSAGE